jgi:HAMP domain-containing protein
MLDPRTLAGRLALAYAAALVFGLVAFAVAAIAMLDVVQRSTLDAQLRTASDGVLSIVDTKRGYVELDADDRRQFARIVGTELSGAVVAPSGEVVAAEATAVPQAVQQIALTGGGAAQVATVSDAAGDVRVVAAPIVGRTGARLGAVVIWRATAPIVALDARVAVAFAVCIPVLALLAVLAGGVIARRGLRPLAAMSTTASEIEATDLSRRMDAGTAPAEVRTFVVAFNRMIDRLQAAFERQKRFTRHTSCARRSQ